MVYYKATKLLKHLDNLNGREAILPKIYKYRKLLISRIENYVNWKERVNGRTD